MSSRERVLILKLDDTQVRDAIKKIQEAGFGTASTTTGSKNVSNIAGSLGASSSLVKMLAKITLIAAGITAIIKAVQKIASTLVDSSPILQTMLKLFQTSITFIFRPIADFLAFFLRPFMVILLRGSLDFYKRFGPELRAMGDLLGKSLIPVIEKITPVIFKGFENLFGNITGFVAIISTISIALESFGSKLLSFNTKDISAQFNASIDRLTSFATSLPERIAPFMTSMISIWEGLKSFVQTIGLQINGILLPIVPVFQGIADFFSNVLIAVNDSFNTNIVPKLIEFSEAISLIIEQAREPLNNAMAAIGSFFSSIAEFFIHLIESINSLIFSIPTALAGLGGGPGGAVAITQNFFEGAIQTGQGVVDDIFSFGEQIGKSINETLSGKVS